VRYLVFLTREGRSRKLETEWTLEQMNDRNRGLRALCLVGVLIAVSYGSACSKSSNDASSGLADDDAGSGVLLITVDGLVPHDLEPFGGTTEVPHLKALISEGRAWGDAWTSSPMTRPAVTTYLTGLTPDRHGVWDDSRDSLAADRSTLAHLFGASGFRTAAFPDAARLGYASGLLEGFEVVDEPPAIPLGVRRWRRELRDPGEQVQHFSTWLSSIKTDDRWFAWLHVSTPVLAQVPGENPSEGPSGPAAFDDWLGQLRESVGRIRGDDAVAIALVGTFADSRGANGARAGVGMSVGEAAVAVPVVLRFPSGANPIPDGAGPVWAPDIPVTLAALAGLSIPDSEGRDLARAVDPDRVLYSWSLAPRDQLGWRPISAARRGDERVRSESPPGTQSDPTGDDSLASRLAARPVVLRPAASDDLRELLTTRGLRPRPVSPEGREFGPVARQRKAAQALLAARDSLQNDDLSAAAAALRRLAAIDRDAISGLLDLGQLQIMGGNAEGASGSLRRAAELYPDDPESIHWYVHATWDPSDAATEKLLRMILSLRSTDPDLLYDLACLRSLEDDLPDSEQFLRSSIDAGFRDWSHMEVDPDLRALRESGRFAAIMRELRQ